MFKDEETRKIMRSIMAQREIHFRGLMKTTGLAQIPIRERIKKLEKAGLVAEKHVGRERRFYLTKKGFAATGEDAKITREEFESFLKSTEFGKELLDTQDLKLRKAVFLLEEQEKRIQMLEKTSEGLTKALEARGTKWETVDAVDTKTGKPVKVKIMRLGPIDFKPDYSVDKEAIRKKVKTKTNQPDTNNSSR